MVAVALTAVAAFGLPRIDTDPTLLSYFAEGSELRSGLDRIDRSGGSSPLMMVVRDPDGRRLDHPAVLERLGEAQSELDADPAVGAALSLPVLVAEARRAPLAGFLPAAQLIDLLDSPRYDRVASSFVTEDRRRGLFFLRMREAERDEPRRRVIDRLASRVAEQGLEVELVGGLYDLQGRLGALVGRSILTGLSALFVLFLGIAVVVSRSVRTTAAMAASLAMVPVLLLGPFGLLHLPLDVVTSPAANVAIALGIDSMIHLATAVRRRRRAGDDEAAAWGAARDRLWQPIAGAMLILAAGFGIFGLSSFPPTARFGLAIAGGTLAAGAIALTVLPRLATAGRR
jgi:predicted RND superfamily exporter protein